MIFATLPQVVGHRFLDAEEGQEGEEDDVPIRSGYGSPGRERRDSREPESFLHSGNGENQATVQASDQYERYLYLVVIDILTATHVDF